LHSVWNTNFFWTACFVVHLIVDHKCIAATAVVDTAIDASSALYFLSVGIHTDLSQWLLLFVVPASAAVTARSRRPDVCRHDRVAVMVPHQVCACVIPLFLFSCSPGRCSGGAKELVPPVLVDRRPPAVSGSDEAASGNGQLTDCLVSMQSGKWGLAGDSLVTGQIVVAHVLVHG